MYVINKKENLFHCISVASHRGQVQTQGPGPGGHLVYWELVWRMVHQTVWQTVRQTHGPPVLTTVTFWLSRSIVYNMNMMNNQ